MEILTLKNVFLRCHRVRKARADIWFVHGFGESGLSFLEAFHSPLSKQFNLFVPDLPGFGVSPFQPRLGGVEGAFRLLQILIDGISGKRPLVIMAHSLGGVIATWLARHYASQVRVVINIEGNLTGADTYFSGLAAMSKSGERFKRIFVKEIYRRMEDDPSLQRYYASLKFADPRALVQWGRSGVAATGLHRSGDEFCGLTCRKIYLWGEKSLPKKTLQYLHDWSIPDREFKGSGHWPMIDQPEEFYKKVRDILEA